MDIDPMSMVEVNLSDVSMEEGGKGEDESARVSWHSVYMIKGDAVIQKPWECCAKKKLDGINLMGVDTAVLKPDKHTSRKEMLLKQFIL